MLFSFHCYALTLEEQVGQLLMVHFNGEIANEEAKFLIQKVYVGGIIYYNWANGLNSKEQVRNLSLSLQRLAKIPLLIAVDQEGGRISRLKKGFTVSPGNRVLADTNNRPLTEKYAFITGKELLDVGINMNLAPVVDIAAQESFIGDRSFGNNVETVLLFAKSALKGYKKSHILTTLKHFPGYGSAIDSHSYLPVVYKSKEELLKSDLRPFFELSSDAIMTAHLMVPALDDKNCTTLSKPTLDLLRTHFQGVIISDSLIMEGLLKNCSSIDEAAIKALNAGCDILLLGGKQLVGARHNFELTPSDIQRIHTSLVNAVRTGIIKEERVDEAFQRITQLKKLLHKK